MYSVAFICSANMCRSPMAHAIFFAEVKRRKLPITVLSAGTWDFGSTEAVTEAQLTCNKRQTPMHKLLSTHIGNIDFSNVTRVFVMEHKHVETLLAETSVPPERITLLGTHDPLQRGDEIDDPIGQNCEAFEACYGRLRECIMHYLDTTDDFSSRR